MKLLKFASWTAAHVAWTTMAFSPVAMGAAAEKVSKQQLQQYFQELGVNKSMTIGEFWEKTRASYPGYLYKEYEEFAKRNKNVAMPELTISSAKATDGSEIPVVTYTMGGKSHTIQIFGEKNKAVRFDNVTLSEADVARPTEAFKRIQANDLRVRKEVDLLKKKKMVDTANDIKRYNAFKKDFARFDGFPRVTPALWKSMTPEKRANYMVRMRLLWLSARKVLENKTYTAAALTPIEQFYKVIFGDEANAGLSQGSQAANSGGSTPVATSSPAPVPGAAFDSNPPQGVTLPGAPVSATDEGQLAPPPGNSSKVQSLPTVTPSGKVNAKGKVVTLPNGKKVQIPFNAESCLVAGYIGPYDVVDNYKGKNRAGCSTDLAIASYETNPALSYVKAANEECRTGTGKDRGPTYRACNPMIYGYPKGQTLCVDSQSKAFQDATTQVGPCDTGSPLSGKSVSPSFTKDYSKMEPRESQIAAIEKDQRNEDYKLTREYLNGVLQKKDSKLFDALGKGEWNLALDDELVRIQNHFEQGINDAIKVCEASAAAGSIQEDKQKAACDQLHRRWLFTERVIAELRAKACVDGAIYIGSYEKDELSSSMGAKTVAKNTLNKKTITAEGVELCQCSDGKKVNFGQKCGTSAIVSGECENGRKKDPVTGSCLAPVEDHSCPVKTHFVAGEDNDICVCDGDATGMMAIGSSDEKAKGICKEDTNWWPLGILAGLGLAALFLHKKKPTPPGPPLCGSGQKLVGNQCMCTTTCDPKTSTQNPTTCACDVIPPAQSCAAPKVGNFPACACPAPATCTPLPGHVSIYNNETCQCTNTPEPVTCPDGSKAAGNKLENCPKCDHGGYKPVGGCNEGGSGDNCPQGNCNGGIPTSTTH